MEDAAAKSFELRSASAHEQQQGVDRTCVSHQSSHRAAFRNARAGLFLLKGFTRPLEEECGRRKLWTDIISSYSAAYPHLILPSRRNISDRL